jgi:hypothetical protein
MEIATTLAKKNHKSNKVVVCAYNCDDYEHFSMEYRKRKKEENAYAHFTKACAEDELGFL